MAKTAVGHRSASAKRGAAKAANGAARKPTTGAAPKPPNGAARKPTNGAARKPTNGTARNGAAHHDDPALARLEDALRAAAAGDFTVRLPARRKDEVGSLEAAYN